MLDAFIIDELRRREQQDKPAEDNRLHVPLPTSQHRRPNPAERGQQQEGFEAPSQKSGDLVVIDLARVPKQ